MTVRAKFYVAERKEFVSAPTAEGATAVEVVLRPIYSDGNTDWSKYTPQGEIKMTITNPSASDELRPGKVFTVDFNEA